MSLKASFTRSRTSSYLIRNANASRLRYGLQTSRDIDSVAIKALALVNNIAYVHSNPEQHWRARLGVEFTHAVLHSGGTFHGPDGTRKLRQDAVSGQIDNTTAELLDDR